MTDLSAKWNSDPTNENIPYKETKNLGGGDLQENETPCAVKPWDTPHFGLTRDLSRFDAEFREITKYAETISNT